MNIAYITNTFTHSGGGIVGAVSGLAQGVDGSVENTSVIAYDAIGELGNWGDLELKTIWAKRLAGVHFGGHILSILDEQSPDLVHAHGLWLRSSQHNHNWCRRHTVPYVISPHGMLDPWAVRNSGWKKKLAGFWFEYAHLRDATCLHALCKSEANSIRQFGQKNPVCVIPNGISLPKAGGRTGVIPWSMDDGRKVLLFLGRIHPKKGLPLLLEAWTIMKKRFPQFVDEWCLAIAGWSEAGHREELEARVEEMGLQHSVEFVGALYDADKSAALANASGFVLPSYSEGLPMSILEAWSYSLPTLITPECNLPEGFKADAAIRIETNSKSIALGLETLFAMSESESDALGKRARRLVELEFVWEQIAAKMISVYEWILGGGEAPECVRFD